MNSMTLRNKNRTQTHPTYFRDLCIRMETHLVNFFGDYSILSKLYDQIFFKPGENIPTVSYFAVRFLFLVWIQFLSRVCWKSRFNSRLHQTWDGKTSSDRSTTKRYATDMRDTEVYINRCHSGWDASENFLCSMVVGGLIDWVIDLGEILWSPPGDFLVKLKKKTLRGEKSNLYVLPDLQKRVKNFIVHSLYISDTQETTSL